jgi:hypothetical protein
MKRVLINLLQSLIKTLESDKCQVSDRQAVMFIEMAKSVAEKRNIYTKTEVADRLHVSTKTVERYIHEGLLSPGRKRRGHTTLYWTGFDISECQERLEDRKFHP